MHSVLRPLAGAVLAFFAPLAALGAAPAEYEQANAAYAAKEFAQAGKLYQQIVASGNYSADLFYNLGDARFQMNEPGLAILNYERALALDPAHAEARANLRLVREKTGARVAARGWTRYVLPEWSATTLTIVICSAAWVAIFAAVALAFRFIPRSGGILTIIVAGLVCAWAAAALTLGRSEGSLAIVVAQRATARQAPAETAPSAETLQAGSRVHVLARSGGWVQCALPMSGKGWIRAESIEQVALGG